MITPKEALDKFPDLQSKLNCKTQDIGVFLRCRLLRGYYDGKKRVAMIEEQSLMDLIKFANDSLDKQKASL